MSDMQTRAAERISISDWTSAFERSLPQTVERELSELETAVGYSSIWLLGCKP